MDQHIGISFGVTGEHALVNAVRQIEQALASLHGKMGSLASIQEMSTIMSQAARSATAYGQGLKQSAQGITDIGAHADATSKHLDRLHSKIKTLAATGGGPGGPGGEIGGRAKSQTGLSPYGFMGRWWGAYAGAGAAKRGFKDVGLGASRENLADQMSELTNVGFTASDKAEAEIRAKRFSTQNFKTSTEDYAKSLYEVGSTLSIDELAQELGSRTKALDALASFNESSIKYGQTAQMAPEKATELLSKMYGAQKAAYTAAGKSAGDYANEMVPKLSRAIEIFQIKGPELDVALRESLPAISQNDWKMSQALAMIGVLKSAGQTPSKTGRFIRNELVYGPEAFARIQGYAEGSMVDTSSLAPGKQKASLDLENKRRQATLSAQYRTDMKNDFFGTMERVRDMYQTFSAQNKSDRLAKLLLQDISPFKQMMAPGTIEEMRKQQGIIEKGTMADVNQKMAEQVKDPGYTYKRLSQAGHNVLLGAADQQAGVDFGSSISRRLENLTLAEGFLKKNSGLNTYGKEWESQRATYLGSIGEQFGTERSAEVNQQINTELSGDFLASGIAGIVTGQLKMGLSMIATDLAPEFKNWTSTLMDSVKSALGFGKIAEAVAPVASPTGGGDSATGRLLSWLTSPGAVSESKISNRGWSNNDPAMYAFQGNGGPVAEKLQPSPERETVVVNPTVQVLLDGRQLEGAVIKTLQKNAAQNRQTFGGGVLGGLNTGP